MVQKLQMRDCFVCRADQPDETRQRSSPKHHRSRRLSRPKLGEPIFELDRSRLAQMFLPARTGIESRPNGPIEHQLLLRDFERTF
jgi:hypothetical protein